MNSLHFFFFFDGPYRRMAGEHTEREARRERRCRTVSSGRVSARSYLGHGRLCPFSPTARQFEYVPRLGFCWELCAQFFFDAASLTVTAQDYEHVSLATATANDSITPVVSDPLQDPPSPTGLFGSMIARQSRVPSCPSVLHFS